MTKDNLLALMSTAVSNAEFRLTNERLLLYPFFDIVTKTCAESIAFVATVVHGDHNHNVVLAYFPKRGYFIWCADKFLEGRLHPADRKVQFDLLQAAGVSKDLIKENEGTYPVGSSCDFWDNWRRRKALCAHTSHVLAVLRDNRPDVFEHLESSYEKAFGVAQPA